MTSLDIARRRLLNQRIAGSEFETPREVVAWLGAVQAQDYAGAKWALGLRLRGATDDDVERAFSDGSIFRTHLLRPTWHFVTPADIRWMLALTAPRVHALNAPYYRKLELDGKVLTRSHAVLVKALRGGQQLTRDELRVVLQRAGVATDGEFRMSYIMMHAELDGIVCSGARRGKQFTYALLDERAPQTKTLGRDEALAELVRRYFMSHGPATVRDFVWWSGLTTADARSGLEAVKGQLDHQEMDSQTFWFSTSTPSAKVTTPTAHLLSNYDEYISYEDRRAAFDMSHVKELVFSHLIVVNGRIVGTWKRTIKKSGVIIESNFFARLTKAEHRSIAAAADQYGEFLGLPVVLT